MKTDTYHEQIISGDVTENEHYQGKLHDFFSTTFNKATSDLLKESEKTIKIRKISSVPTTYLTCELFFEERSIYATHRPSSFVQTTSSQIHSPSEYNMWDVNCSVANELFTPEENTYTIGESMYLSNCNACNTTGKVPCTCGTGYESCPSCNGYGNWRCNTCGGNGEHYCNHCNGTGYTTRLEIVGYDNNNVPVWDNVQYSCSSCRGSGMVICSNCGGSGSITCNTCHGDGQIICRNCQGSKYVICECCSGYGYFLDSVDVKQIFDTYMVTTLLQEKTPDAETYSGQTFQPFNPHQNDLLIQEFTNEDCISQIPLFEETYTLSTEMTQLTDFLNQVQVTDSRHPIQYRIRVYQREVLDAEYTFQDQVFHVIVNYSTNEFIMDINPYKNVAEVLHNELKEHVKRHEFKSFLAKYKEFVSITAFDNITYSEKEIHPLLIRLHFYCSAASIVASFIAPLLWLIISNNFSTFVWIIIFVLSGLSGFVISKLWKKFSTDIPWKMYTLLGTLSSLAGLIIILIFYFISTLI